MYQASKWAARAGRAPFFTGPPGPALILLDNKKFDIFRKKIKYFYSIWFKIITKYLLNRSKLTKIYPKSCETR